MNSKQVILILAFAFAFYIWQTTQTSAGPAGGPQTAQVTNCGTAPGDAPLATRLSWALCESKKSADADKAVRP